MPRDAPLEPWLLFLNDFDRELEDTTSCIAWVASPSFHGYGLQRATVDIDVIAVVPYSNSPRLLELAGRESGLVRKHKI